MGRKLLIANAKHAVNQASINQTDVGNTLIPLPPLDEQEEIMKILDELLSSSDRMDDECGYRQKQSLALRQSILSAAFQGQLTSRDVMIEQA